MTTIQSLRIKGVNVFFSIVLSTKCLMNLPCHFCKLCCVITVITLNAALADVHFVWIKYGLNCWFILIYASVHCHMYVCVFVLDHEVSSHEIELLPFREVQSPWRCVFMLLLPSYSGVVILYFSWEIPFSKHFFFHVLSLIRCFYAL